VGLYLRQNPPVYAGGAYPNELTQNYQDHYLAMVIDSYIVNRQAEAAAERLKAFDQAAKIRALGRWSANYVAGGRATEAQAVNELAVKLKEIEQWQPETISAVAGQLATEFQTDGAKSQAINTFAGQLGQVPVESAPAPQAAPAEAAPAEPAPAEDGGTPAWQLALLCCLGLLLIGLIAFLVYRRFGGKAKPAAPQVVWEGEGPAPVKSWSGTYTLERDTFDESFTVETENGAFVGEVGMSISETVLSSLGPKQVTAFDVWVFDKTDITTYTTVLLTEQALQDDKVRAALEGGSQVRPVVAEPGEEFTVEGAAIRADAVVKNVQLAQNPAGKEYFDRLEITLNVFIKEGADLKIGTMEIPDKFKLRS
jgi:hypothetical protein